MIALAYLAVLVVAAGIVVSIVGWAEQEQYWQGVRHELDTIERDRHPSQQNRQANDE